MTAATVLEPPSPPRHRAAAGVPRQTVRMAWFVLASGFAFDVGLRGGVANAVAVAGGAFVVAALVTSGALPRVEARCLAVAALLPAAFLAVRASPWLVTSNALAAVGLVGAAVVHARSGSVLDTTPRRLAQRAGVALSRVVTAPALLRPLAPRPSGTRADAINRVTRAVLVAAPILAVVVALLASADAVFANLLSPDVSPGPPLGHVALVCLFGFGVLCVVAAASGDADDEIPSGRFGTIEIATMLALAAFVMGLFVVSQLVALTSAGHRLIDSAGLTPAVYARSGFFQLCWATGVLVGFLALVRSLAAPGVLAHPVVRRLAGLVPVLALGLVAVSLRRMALYDQAFGLTMLRLWVIGAAAWMGSVLLLVAARNLDARAGRDWVVGGAGAVALALLVVANLANPEAFIVNHNVGRAAAGTALDDAYLGQLSADAVPAIVDVAATTEDAALQARLLDAIGCGSDRHGAAALNVGEARAAAARRDACAARAST